MPLQMNRAARRSTVTELLSDKLRAVGASRKPPKLEHEIRVTRPIAAQLSATDTGSWQACADTALVWIVDVSSSRLDEMSKEMDQEAFSDFVRALAFASHKHSKQRRKDVDASPYINHPITLVSILTVEAGINDRDTLCAALLHDTIEDTKTSVEELVKAFGSLVASLVQEVTDDKQLPKTARKLRQVEHAAHLSPKARSVKLADKIANLRDVADSPPVNWSLARRREYFDWAKQVVDQIPEPPAELLRLFMAVYDRRP